MKLTDIENAVSKARWHLIDGTQVKEEEIGESPAFLLRRPSPKELRGMQRKAQKKLHTGRRRGSKNDEDKLHELLLHFTVEDWRNLTQDKRDEDGKVEKDPESGEAIQVPLPCTRENRDYLDDLWGDFTRLWVDVATDSTSIEELMEEEESGN